jgi:hypothetical protein
MDRRNWTFRVVHPLALVLAAALTGAAARADIVWRVADEGPRSPGEARVFGTDSRVLAFAPDGVRELVGSVWQPVPLDSSAAGGAEPEPAFVAGGRLFATTRTRDTLRFFELRGNAWVHLATVSPAFGPILPSDDRVFVLEKWIGSCGSSTTCPAGEAPPRLRSVSLLDGSVRDEPPLPGCAGTVFVLAGRLHLINHPVESCAQPSAAARSAGVAATAPAYPFYRLDGDGWTLLPPWNVDFDALRSTPNSLWVFAPLDATHLSARVLTVSGLSEPMVVPGEYVVGGRLPEPLEARGRLFVATGEASGSIHELRDGSLVRLAPEAPVTEPGGAPLVSAAGRRLFAWAKGWEIHALENGAWSPTSGLLAAPGADRYLPGTTRLYATVGARVFRRDPTGWVRLPALPVIGPSWGMTVVGDQVVVGLTGGGRHRLYGFDLAREAWVDLDLPAGFGPIEPAVAATRSTPAYPILPEDTLASSSDAVYVGGSGGRLARYRAGTWATFAAPVPPEPGESRGSVVRVLSGVPYLLDGASSPRRCEWVLRNERLEEAFPGLDPTIRVLDVASASGVVHLAVECDPAKGGLRPALMASSPGFQTLLTAADLERSGLGALPPALSSLGDTLLVNGLAYSRGQLRARPGGIVAAGGGGTAGAAANHRAFLVPVERVRKNFAAVVDTTGFGGTRYRSVLTLANLSSSRSAVARLFPGGAKVPGRELPLAPGAQVRLEDPFPGFVGPLAVEFDGLTEEEDAWASLRVWSASEGGTAGTSLVGTDPGGVPGFTVALPPVSSPGSRLRVAFAASSDGPAAGLLLADPREPVVSGGPFRDVTVASGRFLQLEIDPERAAHPLFVRPEPVPPDSPFSAPADLLGYLVRNDGTTNDGAVVPFEPPDAIPGRRVRFLPAVVGLTSGYGTYRTQLTLSWQALDRGLLADRQFAATYRDERGSTRFLVDLAKAPWRNDDTYDTGVVLELPDAGAWLVANGVPIDPDDFAGTLTFTSSWEQGAADLLVTAVVERSAGSSGGRYGAEVPVLNEVRWAKDRAIVPGLREDGSFRSNVALANPEADGGPDVTLEVTLHRASDGAVIGTLPRVWLPPGRRFQLNRPLGEVGYGGDAWAEVRRVGGTGRFVAYGVVNDNVTSDGTLLPMAGAE